MKNKDVQIVINLLIAKNIQLKFIKNLNWSIYSNERDKWEFMHNFEIEQLISDILKESGNGNLCTRYFGSLMASVREVLKG